MLENKNYCVYCHIFPNGKKYVGITGLKPEYRWQNGKGYKTQFVSRAIKKYGWDNIEHKILFNNLTKKEAERIEMICISLFKSNKSEFGYNIENGGNGSNKKSKAEREAMSKNRKGKQTGGDNPVAKKVICITTNKIFDCISDGACYYGISSVPNIRRSCNTGRSCGKYEGKKLYWSFYNDDGTYIKLEHKTHDRKVHCITTNKTFNSIKEASKYYDICYDSIQSCCAGRYKSAGTLSDGTKLIWKYA